MKVRLLITSKKRCFFALSEVSFQKLSKTVPEYEFITKYLTKLIMNETELPRVRSASYQRAKHWRSPWSSTLYHIILAGQSFIKSS